MTALYTVAYPDWPAETHAFVDALRRAHDPQHGVVGAHFTLLFGSDGLGRARYARHVRASSRGMRSIDFVCRYAMLHADLAASRFQVHLVPDEGFAAIAGLRDRLAAGVMAPLQGLHIAYVPHVTVATLPDLESALALRDRLNRQGVIVPGRLSRLSIGTVQDGRFWDLSWHDLDRAP